MNKQLAIEIINLIQNKGGLNYISLMGGVAQTLEVDREDLSLTGVITKRSPYTTFVITDKACDFETENKSLVLDSSERGILYFEENGVSIDKTQSFSGGRRKWISKLDVICWLNKKLIIGDEQREISVELISELLNKLIVTNKDLGYFKCATIRTTGVKPNNASIFSKYSYSEKTNQYLMPPFEYFSMSLEITYFMSSKCVSELIIKESKC